jgi:hypothetical protein
LAYPATSELAETSPTSVSVAPAPTTEVTTTTKNSVSEPSTTVVLDECLRTLPFTPTYLPEGFDPGLRPGNGGEVGVDPDGTVHPFEPPVPYFVHYSAHAFRLGTFINITVGGGETAASYESMTVLGGPAQFGHIEDGYVVVFHTDDRQCPDYAMMTYGVSPEDTRRVAEGLVATA